MNINLPVLFIEIGISEIKFTVGKEDKDRFQLILEKTINVQGIKNKKIHDFDLLLNLFKTNIYLIEQKLNFTFKETILILENLNFSLLNLSGYKRLNGSQLKRENITFILNSLKAKVEAIENQKKVIHIFNSKYILDKNIMENLPIGLFGNFYSQELSFFLIDKTDFKNLENIFNRCNLRLKKIILKSFVEGVSVINNLENTNTFFIIKIMENHSKIIFFENLALKYIQDFNFGINIIIDDISKITSIKKESIIKILLNSNFYNSEKENETVEKEFFKDQTFRKIKKEFILKIANARIEEIAEVLYLKNVNTQSLLNNHTPVFLQFDKKNIYNSLEESFRTSFSKGGNFNIKYLEKIKEEKFFENIYSLVQFGWNKEAIPIIHKKKSFIVRIFDFIFNR